MQRRWSPGQDGYGRRERARPVWGGRDGLLASFRPCADPFRITISVPRCATPSGTDLSSFHDEGYDGDEPPHHDLLLLALPDGADAWVTAVRRHDLSLHNHSLERVLSLREEY